MSIKFLMLSIHPYNAQNIINGIKTVELRRISPKIEKNDLVFLYVTSPVKAIMGAFKVDYVLTKSPKDLWEMVKDRAALSRQEFDKYYGGTSKGVAIFFTNVWQVREPIKLQQLREWWPGFNPPRTYFYLNGNKNIKILLQALEEKQYLGVK